VALLGPNGAGKTTCISVLLGLRKATAGEARLFGLEPTDRRARSRCGVMLQESGVPDTLTVRELVELFGSYYPHPMPTERAIGLAGLEPQSKQQAGKLSGGQRQRLYFALAVAGDPEVIFFDEPTVGMDVESRRLFLQSIRDFSKQGKTILLTTHYLEEAEEADRICIIDKGKVVSFGTPDEIKRDLVEDYVLVDATDRSALGDELARLGYATSGGAPFKVQLDGHTVHSILRSIETPLSVVKTHTPTLEDAYLEIVGRGE